MYSLWVFRYASGMAQEHTNTPYGIGNYFEKQRLRCSPQSRPSGFCLATKIPQNLMCPAAPETLEINAFLLLHPEETLASTGPAEYLCE